MSLAVLAGRAGLVGLCLCALAAPPDLPASPAQPVAAVLEREIEALVLLAGNRKDEAVASLREAAAEEAAMPLEFGPPLVDKPAHELLADVLLALGRPVEAASAYESALKRAPNRAASVKGLAPSKE